MTGPKTGIRGTILVFVASTLFTLSACTPAQRESPSLATRGDPHPLVAVVLTNGQGEYPLGLHMEILEDPGGQLTFEEVSSPSFDARFTPSQAQNPVYGLTNSVYWVRFELDNEASRRTNWVLTLNFANLHYVDLYTPWRSGGGFSVDQSGILRPVSARDYLFSHIAFGLSIPAHTQQTYYLRFKNGASMTLGATLRTMREFVRHSQQELLLYGVLFGALAALLAYHVFLLLTIREQTYLYFVILLACMLVTLLIYNGYMAAFVFPNVNAMSLYVFPVTNAGIYLTIGLFSSAFLELKTRHPRLYWINMIVAGVWGALILLTFLTSFGNIAQWMTAWAIVTLVVVLVSGFVAWWRGFHPGAIFLISWLALVVSLLLLESVRRGYVTSSFIAENSFQPALIVMAVGWSIALADRINELKANTEEANQELQNSQRELSQILNGVPLGIVVYGKDQMPRYINERATEMLSNPKRGIQPRVAARRTLAQVIDYYSLHIAGTNVKYPLEKYPIYRALKGEPCSVDDVEADLVDRLVPIEMWASPVRDKVGNIEAAVAAFQDITQRKQAEAELEVYRKQLEIMVQERTMELQLHVDWLSAINQVNQILAGSADFAQIYGKIVGIINHLFAAQDSFIAEWEGQDQQLKILEHSCPSNLHPGLVGSLIRLPKNIPSLSNLEKGTFGVFPKEQIEALDGPLGSHIQASKAQHIVLLPLRLREQTLGFLGLELEEAGRTFTREEVYLLSILSIDIAQLIEDAHRFGQTKLLIAAEERHHLARELHDSVAQALYSINLFTDATLMAWETNKPQVVKDNLSELVRLSRQAMGDMRLLIFELRPPDLEQAGLVASLQSRLDSVEAKAGIQVGFHSEGELSLSAEEEVELYWIAQEALNNVIKHAHANRLEILLMREAGCVRLVIEDDGLGFAPDNSGHSGGQGIRNIRERAEKIGAGCWIESAPDQGTRVTIEVKK